MVGKLGQPCTRNIGLESARRENSRRTELFSPCLLGRSWLRPAQDGSDLGYWALLLNLPELLAKRQKNWMLLVGEDGGSTDTSEESIRIF